ncbi:MAG: ATP--guanido phosphotransferase [Gemmatimonadetes bacterium]|nr:ATP--guanido phosphotransferase [Gemmatimonadota bacterium]
MIDFGLLPDGGVRWLDASGPESHLVLSTRIRLARNISGRRFAGRMDPAEYEELVKEVETAARQTSSLGQAVELRIDGLSQLDRRVLLERHLISRELAGLGGLGAAGRARALLLQDRLAVMVNEEDHLRLQAMASGADFGPAWEAVAAADAELGQRLAFAFHPQFGYLTSCPTNVGTGLRASVLIHLPGLVLTKEISKTLHGLSALGLTYRGLYGEGSEVVGNFFQLSNQTTLGRSEGDLIDRLRNTVRRIVEVEQEARQVLLRDAPAILEDKCWRAFGLLRYARSLSFEETMNLLSGVRLGVSLGLITSVSLYALNRLLVFTQPAHLQAAAGGDVSDQELALRRAELVRRVLETEVRRTE